MSVTRARLTRAVPWVIVVCLVVVAFVLASCSTAPRHGRVIQKQYIAAHYDYHQAPKCSYWVTHSHTGTRTSTSVINGRSYTRTSTYTYFSTDCAFWTTRTWRTWVNDQWGLRLNDNGNLGYRYVDLVTYDACAVGQYYDDSGVCR